MTAPLETVSTPKPRRRRWLRRLVITLMVLILTPILLVLGLSIYLRVVGGNRLEKAIAEADRLHPGWRWDELEAKRAPVPDAENAALVVEAAAKHLPQDSPNDDFGIRLGGRLPNVRLDEKETQDLQKWLKMRAVALPEARKLAKYRAGRFPPLSYEQWVALAYRDHYGRTIRVASLLEFDMLFRLEGSQVDAALQLCRAIIGAGRALGDETALTPQMIRLMIQGFAWRGVQRTLAQGEASEAELLAMQQLLQEELDQPVLLTALRGERASAYDTYRWLEAGDPQRFPPGAFNDITLTGHGTALGRVEHWLKAGFFRENSALAVEHLTEAIEYARLPLEEQPPKFAELEKKPQELRKSSIPIRHALAVIHMMAIQKLYSIYFNNQAELRCTVAALAAERYRLKHGEWPDSLNQLVPDLLPSVPLDPFDGKPLRYQLLNDGVAIYSIGPNRKDNGGRIYHVTPRSGGSDGSATFLLPMDDNIDLGIRLWDVAERRQPVPERGEE